jgi:branched-chain amino acid transport system ATP-binding protein
MLKVSGLVAGYGKVPALHAVDISVEAGELVTIIGSNGAGKSTLLKTISGLVKVMEGRIEFDGQDITNRRPDKVVRRGLVHCPEGRHVFPGLTAYDNLRLGAHVGKNFEERLEEVYTLFPRIKERAEQLAGSMSGGEQQMLVIGRSLMCDPAMVMLDEPSLGLAPIVVEQVLATCAQIRDSGRTVLLVEQNAELALEVADRAYVLERGNVVTQGPAAEIASSPAIQQAYLAG